MDSHQLNITEQASMINTIQTGIASNKAAIEYHSSQAAPDNSLIHELKSFVENEIARLQSAWDKVKQAGIDFFNEVLGIIKGIFAVLEADLIKFLEKLGIKI